MRAGVRPADGAAAGPARTGTGGTGTHRSDPGQHLRRPRHAGGRRRGPVRAPGDHRASHDLLALRRLGHARRRARVAPPAPRARRHQLAPAAPAPPAPHLSAIVQCPDHQPGGLPRLEVRCEPPLRERPGTSRQGRPRDRIDPRLRYNRDLHQRIHSLQAVSPDRHRAQEPVAQAPQAGHRSDRGVWPVWRSAGGYEQHEYHGRPTGGNRRQRDQRHHRHSSRQGSTAPTTRRWAMSTACRCQPS